jgi:DNA repair protein RadC
MKSDRIKNWPKQERPRERLMAAGAEKLTDAELLAIIPRVGQGLAPRATLSEHVQMFPCAEVEDEWRG